MKTNYIIIVAGLSLFILGITLILNNDYRNFLFDNNPDLGIVGFFVTISAGLVITGLGIMLEFARRKYEAQK